MNKTSGLLRFVPGSSDGKESACNARDLGLIPGWEDPLEKGMATHSSILAWRIPWAERGAWQATVHGITKSQTQLNDQHFHFSSIGSRQTINK